MMEILLAAVLMGVLFIIAFILGALFVRHLIMEAQEQARYDRMSEEYFKMAGANGWNSPRPYVPPRPRTPRRRILPHLDKIDRMMHEGKRATVMVRAGDRKGVTR